MTSALINTRPVLAPIALAIGLVLAQPAQADPAGPACWVKDPITGEWVQDNSADRTMGNELGTRNSTCAGGGQMDSNAYGHGNNASTANSTALGYQNVARADLAMGYRNQSYGGFAVGSGNTTRNGSTAAGYGNEATGVNGSREAAAALGDGNTASGGGSVALGISNKAEAHRSLAMGYLNQTSDRQFKYAIGANNRVEGDSTLAMGSGSRAAGGLRNMAIGHRATAAAAQASDPQVQYALAFGFQAQARANRSVAAGWQARTHGDYAVAAGHAVEAGAEYAVALGGSTKADGARAVAIGHGITASGEHALAAGTGATAEGVYGVALGHQSMAKGRDAVMIGRGDFGVQAEGVEAVSRSTGGVGLGAAARVNEAAVNSMAIGAGSIADEADTVSFGADGRPLRRLVNIAAATAETDVINVSQLHAFGGSVAALFGGGAAFAAGQWTAPSYVIGGQSFGNIGDAFAAVDGSLGALDGRITVLENSGGGLGTPGPRGPDGYSAYEVAVQNGFQGSEAEWQASLVGPRGPQGPQGPAGPDGGGLEADQVRAIATEVSASGDARTLTDANAHTDTRETAVRSDIKAGDAATLGAANKYTDAAIRQLIGFNLDELGRRMDSLHGRLDGMDARMDEQHRRLNRIGSMNVAMLNMAINAAGGRTDAGRIAFGIGFHGGERSVSFGYGRRLGRGSLSFGGAISGSERTIGIGYGITM